MPTQALKPLELVLAWRRNCSWTAKGELLLGLSTPFAAGNWGEGPRNLRRQWEPNLSRKSVGFPEET